MKSRGVPAASSVYNVNVGVLGHVDSGKTSLGELSDMSSQIRENALLCLKQAFRAPLMDVQPQSGHSPRHH